MTEQTEPLAGLRAIGEHAGWFLPCARVCFVAERHTIVRQDAQRRLHCEDGPALQYPDGWALYRWHGVTIPGWIVDRPQDITPELIAAETNAEVRRVMLHKFGIPRYLEVVGGIEIDRDRDLHGDRVLYELRNQRGVRLVKLENSTRRPGQAPEYYTLRVPPETKTCRDAVAYCFSMDPNRYNPSVET